MPHNVEAAFAYNSPFDDRVFAYNCEWFHTNNPLEAVPVKDIRGMVSEFITNQPEYREFCEKYQLFTEAATSPALPKPCISSSRTTPEFVEDHTALSDAEIEAEILLYCLDKGADLMGEYAVPLGSLSATWKSLKIVVDGEVIYNGGYVKKVEQGWLLLHQPKQGMATK